MPNINQLPEITAITDDDLILLWDAESQTTAYIKAVNLKAYLGSNPPVPSNVIFRLIFSSNGAIADQTGKTVQAFGAATSSNTRVYNGQNTLTLTGNTADYISISGNGINLNSSNNFSIKAALFLTAEQPNGRTICANIPGIGNRGFNFMLNSSRQPLFQCDGANPTIQSNLIVPLNVWSVVEVAKNGNLYTFKVDSQQQEISNATSWQSSTLNDLFVGRTPRNDFPFPFNGSIGLLEMRNL